MSAQVRFPTRTIALVLAVSTCLIAWLIWTGESTGKRLTSAYERATAGEKVLGEIGRLDEVLTGSARMASATGAPQWKARYDQTAPQNDKAMADAQALASPALREQFKAATGAANDTLLKLEGEAFAAATRPKLRRSWMARPTLRPSRPTRPASRLSPRACRRRPRPPSPRRARRSAGP